MEPTSWLFLASLSQNSFHPLSEREPVCVSSQSRFCVCRASVFPVPESPCFPQCTASRGGVQPYVTPPALKQERWGHVCPVFQCLGLLGPSEHALMPRGLIPGQTEHFHQRKASPHRMASEERRLASFLDPCHPSVECTPCAKRCVRAGHPDTADQASELPEQSLAPGSSLISPHS